MALIRVETCIFVRVQFKPQLWLGKTVLAVNTASQLPSASPFWLWLFCFLLRWFFQVRMRKHLFEIGVHRLQLCVLRLIVDIREGVVGSLIIFLQNLAMLTDDGHPFLLSLLVKPPQPFVILLLQLVHLAIHGILPL